MVEIGIRELKARLSYYVQLMRTGETIAIKVRNHVVGFLSQHHPAKEKSIRSNRAVEDKLIQQLKAEGRISGGARYRNRPVKPVRLTPGPTMAEIIRKMRDEEL